MGLALRYVFDILCLFPQAPGPGLPGRDAGDDDLEAHPRARLPGRPDLAAWAAWEGEALLSPLEEKRVLPGWHAGPPTPGITDTRVVTRKEGRQGPRFPKASLVPLGASGLLAGRRTSRIIIDRLRSPPRKHVPHSSSRGRARDIPKEKPTAPSHLATLSRTV